jgi:6-pyruvoyltetrahydropterin/6-carboxytetrahydropterin synthase
MSIDSAVKTIRRFHISAARRLFHPAWTTEENARVFGSRTTELGYGANFTMFVAVESRVDPATGMTVHTDDIRKVVDPVLAKFDHRHMTLETDHFTRAPATSEAIASVLFDLIRPGLPERVQLANVVVWESRSRWADRSPSAIRSGALHDVFWRTDEAVLPTAHSTLTVVRAGDSLGVEGKPIDDACEAFAHEAKPRAGDARTAYGVALAALKERLTEVCGAGSSRVDRVALSDAFLGELSLDAVNVVRLSRAYDFEATHRMYNAQLSEAENYALFGKGTNPFGHGHSFHVRVSARVGGWEDAQALAQRMDDAAHTVTGQLHRRRLELEVPFFKDRVATSENVALWIWSELRERLGERLDGLTVWGTENNLYEIGNEIPRLSGHDRVQTWH